MFTFLLRGYLSVCECRWLIKLFVFQSVLEASFQANFEANAYVGGIMTKGLHSCTEIEVLCVRPLLQSDVRENFSFYKVRFY